MRKSVSMGNLHHYASSNNPPSPPENSESGAGADGYVSDGLVHTSNNTRERKKGELLIWALHHHLLLSQFSLDRFGILRIRAYCIHNIKEEMPCAF
jgi:hypothetical protein